MKKKQYFCGMKKIIYIILFLAVIALGVASCNVTRTVTTSSEAYQKGDTSVHIVTRTVESYDATKNIN